MTDQLKRLPNIDVHARYAPKRIREAASQPGSNNGSRTPDASHDHGRSAPEPLSDEADENFAAEELHFEQTSAQMRFADRAISLGPRVDLSRSRPLRRVMGVKAWLLFGLVGAISAIWTNRTITGGERSSFFWSRSDVATKPEGTDHAIARLVISDATPRHMGEESPLGVSLTDLNRGGLIVVKGLANGAQMSAGDPADNSSWWLSARDLDNVMIRPPANFVGSMDVGVELRLADTSLSDYRTLHFEWTDAPESASRSSVAAEAAIKPQATHQIPSQQILASLNRGKELIGNGDFAAARLVLQRATDGGSAQAAMMLAGTYDPMVLEKLRAHGCVPDISKARYWYEKANELGSPDAPKRLKVLATRRD